MPGDRPISPLILAELYESGDGSFVEKIIEYRGNFKPLIGVIERWKKDNSPGSRQMKLAFIRDERLTDGHRLVFKRLFKQAWHDRDHELMAAFMVRLDRSLRRHRRTRYQYINRTIETSEVLRLAPRDRRTMFSTPTKHYLRRRAWRYFRRLGFQAPAEYAPAVAIALVQYTDDDVRLGENLLDNWGLMHACFGKSPVLTFNARYTNLKTDQSLADLQAAPMFERLWSAPESAAILLTILLDASCRPVRVWAIQLLNRHHASSLASIDASLLLRLIDHPDGDVAAFAAELLNNATTVRSFTIAVWLRLLATRNPTVVAAVVEAFRKHVSLDRVTLAQAVEIASHAAAPVARLGLEILEARSLRGDADFAAVAQLAGARSSAWGEAIAKFAMAKLNVSGVYRLQQVVAFFDSNLPTMRAGAFAALDDTSPAGTDPAFWAALIESPYDDVRANLVQRLKHRQTLPGATGDTLAYLWTAVLLNIHRGGRAKLSALMQMSRQITLEPQSAAVLLPVLAVAIRSVRTPEARHGLAAVVTAVERIPALAGDVARYLPELDLTVSEASA